MNSRNLVLPALVIACINLVFVSIAWSANKSSADINVLLKDEQKELSILKAKIAKQEKLISSVGKKEGQVLGKLKKIDNQIKLKERELKIYQWNSLINKKKLTKLKIGLKKNKKELETQKISLGKRFRQIYKEGTIFPLKVAFSSESVSDLLQRIKYLELIAEYDASLMANFKSRQEDLEKEKNSLLSVRAKFVRLEKDALIKQSEFESARKDKKYFLKSIKKKKKLGIQTRKELLKASNNLNDLIQKILEKLVSGEGLDISDKKGRLSLPLKGEISPG